MTVLDGDLASAVTAALIDAGVPYAVTVTRTTHGAPDPSTPWIPGEPVPTAYACQGWVEAYTADEIDGTLIRQTDVRVIVLLQTIARADPPDEPDDVPDTIMPAAGDSVTVRGSSYLVVSVALDPALATASLQVRA